MENNNSVCFIAKINSLAPIEGADKIELAQINGWTSVVQKDKHKVGDLVLCITTDAVIPENLAESWGVKNYLRSRRNPKHDIFGPVLCVRTVKLKGVYSECILISKKEVGLAGWIEGHDLMSTLSIFKYEPPAITIQEKSGRKHKYHQNPNFHIYYKFPNQKNVPNMFNEEDEVVITRKIHGTNARYGIVKKSKLSILDKIRKFFGNKWIEYEYVYGSHNVEKGSDSQGFYSTDVWKEVADKYDIKNKLWYLAKFCPEFKEGVVVYGEIYGEGIQGEKYSYGLKTKELVIFDIQLNLEYVNHFQFNYLNKGYLSSLPVVSQLYIGKWSKEMQDSFVTNQFIDGTNTPHEGIVVKHISGDRKKVSKVINPDYLIFGEKYLVPDSH